MRRPTFARILSDLMRDRGMEPTALADAAGLTRQAVHKLLNGSAPTWDTVQRLADALGVSTEAFRTASAGIG